MKFQPDPATASAKQIQDYANEQAEMDLALGMSSKYPSEAGVLSAYVSLLCAQRDTHKKDLDFLMGIGLQPARGHKIATVYLGDAAVPAEYEFRPGTPDFGGRGAMPAEAAEVETLRLFINGRWCDVLDVVGKERAEELDAFILDRHGEKDQIEAEEAAYERQQERLAERQFP